MYGASINYSDFSHIHLNFVILNRSLHKQNKIVVSLNMIVQSTYDTVADFIASMNPQMVLDMQASADMQKRLEELISQEKNTSLSPAEKDELDHYIVLERLIRLAKARALYRLAQ